ELMGLPFEGLRTSDDEPLIAHHKIKYAFGLPTGRIATAQIDNYQKALVFGAEKFHKPGFPSLDAGKEVSLLRYWLLRWGGDLEPSDALPQAGGPLLAGNKTFDLIHISTHSYLDTGLPGKYSVPMVDALEFPQDEVFAFDLALSPARAKLMVLSACELFRARQDDYTPVSGVTTVSMARISPQVISTLWRVNAEATRVFMLRFYDALLKEKDPSAALAIAKRAFLNPDQLRSWLTEKGIQIPANIQSYKKLYYWAPFVLTISTS